MLEIEFHSTKLIIYNVMGVVLKIYNAYLIRKFCPTMCFLIFSWLSLLSPRAQEISTHMAGLIGINSPCWLEPASCSWIQQMFLLSGPMETLWTFFLHLFPGANINTAEIGIHAKWKAEGLVRKLGTPLLINSGHQWFEWTIKPFFNDLFLFICYFI